MKQRTDNSNNKKKNNSKTGKKKKNEDGKFVGLLKYCWVWLENNVE